MSTRCEDFPCCGHTYDDPCGVQPYDAPGYYDTSRPGNEHALCEHEDGFCDVEDEWEDEDEPDDDFPMSVEYGEDRWDGMEDAWLDGSYED